MTLQPKSEQKLLRVNTNGSELTDSFKRMNTGNSSFLAAQKQYKAMLQSFISANGVQGSFCEGVEQQVVIEEV